MAAVVVARLVVQVLVVYGEDDVNGDASDGKRLKKTYQPLAMD